ncbi:MAG: hypothetical protein Kow0031_00490 [Anaerolineae bacterium]
MAANLFALTALLVGLNNFSRGAQSWRLLPLFLLTASRALMLIISLVLPGAGAAGLVGALDVFSVLCVVWSLTDIRPDWPVFWRRLVWLAGGAALILSLLPLVPGWPLPAGLHAITVAVFSTPFILVGLRRVEWLHVAVPLVLALAYLLGLAGNQFLAGVLLLLAYALLVAALHREEVVVYRGRRAQSEAMARQALSLSEERQRLLEVSEIISAVPSVEQSMAHVARTMAHVTQADQTAVFVLDTDDDTLFRLAAVYSPERPVTLTGRYRKTFNLASFSVLERALAEQTQMMLTPKYHQAELSVLYALWFEDRTGPTLLQPVSVQGYAVGALLVGNPVTQRPFHPNDPALCRSLSAQIGSMAESYRRHFDLEQRINEALEEAERREQERVATAATGGGVTVPAGFGGESGAPAGASGLRLADEPAILEAVHEGVVVADAAGRVRLVNRAAERILGKSRQELLGQPIGDIYGQIDSSESIEELAADFSRRSKPLPTFVETKERAVQGQLIPWRNEAQEWLGIIAIFWDVTLQIKADRTRHDFITALSRELRAPLTTIKGYSELIMRGDLSHYTPAQVYVQNIMHSSVDRMVAVLDNAIQLGVQTRKKAVPQFEDVDATELIELVCDEIGSLVELHELKLTADIKEPLPVLTADRTQLHRILMNLLENACYYTPPGGEVTLRAWVQGEFTDPGAQAEMIFSVADNGVGISVSEQRRIFEPFYQIPGVLHSGGMGMGLAVVKDFVEMHKGRVWVESMERDGSIFQVALPLRQL